MRGRHVLLAPERAFGLDEAAVAVVELVDGHRSVDDIVDALATAFAEAREVIAADVAAMLADLAAKRVLELMNALARSRHRRRSAFSPS